ncbi:hypothetical protein J31TS4_13900 [Paenibacillus sp. J31TS4]|uniref:extracellular solute-binding protein n=1 Tax=Paenibacillus sp. J31TS4 TaxID=2807195 RepID=UPI001B1E375E|nr:extracellular solute-binding protein [Paenibacillus sp. J31TS4]GIP38110.1 hypothetical protein J31TS4_13900 [Paenibacillus sp. J31TS4]
MKVDLLLRIGGALLAGALAAGIAGCEDSKGAASTDFVRPFSIDWLTYQYGPVAEDAPVKRWLEARFNVRLNVWNLDVTKRGQMLGEKLSEGRIPDFMTVYSGSDLQKFARQGVIAGFTQQELETYMPHYKRLVDSCDPRLWEYVRYKGEYIGIPGINSDGVYSLATAWRQDWLERVGITKTPETLEEFEEAVYRFRNGDPNGNGLRDTHGMSKDGMIDVYGAYGVHPEMWTERGGELVWSGILPETRRALETLARWRQDGVIDPEWAAGENNGGYWAVSHAFVNGRIGVTTHGSYYHWLPASGDGSSSGGDNTKLLAEATGGRGRIALGPPPVGPEGKFGNSTPGLVGGSYMAFGQQAEPEKRHRIMQIWDALYSDYSFFLRAKFGEEGVHYEIGEDGYSIVMKEGFRDPVEQARIGAHITFTPFAQPEFLKKQQNPELLALKARLFQFPGAGYENAVKSPLPSEGLYQASLLELQRDMFAAIIDGKKPLTEFDRFVAEWKQGGGEQLTREANEWRRSLR